MFLLAWRQLRVDPVRTLITALALAAVVAVILVLEGFEQGQYFQMSRIVLNRGGDLIVMQSGVSNFIAVRSSVPQLSRSEVEAVNGVVNAHPITAVPVIYEKNNVRSPIYMLVVDTKGGPSTIVQGSGLSDGRDIVVDGSLAAKHDIQVGDSLLVSDFEFIVSGITQDAAAFFTPFAFIGYDGMIDLFLESELAPDISTFPLLSFMLVELAPGVDRSVVTREIETRVPSVDVYTPEQVAQNDVNLVRSLLGPIFGLLVVIGYVVGLLVVGLIMYAEVTARLTSFGVLKALGFSNGRLGYGVLIQALLLLLAAIPIGVIFALAIGEFIHWAAPVYLIRVLDPLTLGHTILASVVFAVVGALVPLGTIRRVDPMVAFQGL